MRKKKKTIKLATYPDGRQAIKIEFPFSYVLVSQIKAQIHGRMYHPDGKYWSCPLTPANLSRLLNMGFEMNSNLKEYYRMNNTKVEDIKEVNVPGLDDILRPYQKKGVSFIESKQGRALLADDMGIGKTIQAIGYLKRHPEFKKILIVCPEVMKKKWAAELKKWGYKKPIELLYGRTPYKIDEKTRVLIINYDILYYWTDPKKNGPFSKMKFDAMILDECHYIKNNSAKRTKAAKAIGKGTKHIIGLTGTPIENRPIEIYNIVNLLSPNLFPNYMYFGKRYCDGKHNGFGWNFNGASNLQELHEILSKTVMIRRRKQEVLTDLPDKQYSTIPLELQNRNDYELAKHNFLNYLIEAGYDREHIQSAVTAEMLVKLNVLRQLAAEGKLEHVIKWIESFLETGKKLVVFAHHTKIINAIYQRFEGMAARIYGGTTDKTAEYTKFQEDPNCRLFVGNMQAAGIGIELTAASDVAIVEFPWSPGILDQAVDRCHRIGQKNAVTVYYLVAEETIDEYMAKLIDQKRNVISQSIDGIEVENKEMIHELIKMLKE